MPVLVASRRVDFHLKGNSFSRWKYRQVDCFIAASEAIRRMLVADGVPADRTVTVHEGIDVDHVLAAPAVNVHEAFFLPHGAPVVGNVAALVPHKGQRYLVEAAHQVVQQLPDTRFVILGEGDLREQLAKQVHEHHLEKHVLAGFRTDVLGCIKGFDLFVMSSVTEGLGTSLLDAMACARPIGRDPRRRGFRRTRAAPGIRRWPNRRRRRLNVSARCRRRGDARSATLASRRDRRRVHARRRTTNGGGRMGGAGLGGSEPRVLTVERYGAERANPTEALRPPGRPFTTKTRRSTKITKKTTLERRARRERRDAATGPLRGRRHENGVANTNGEPDSFVFAAPVSRRQRPATPAAGRSVFFVSFVSFVFFYVAFAGSACSAFNVVVGGGTPGFVCSRPITPGRAAGAGRERAAGTRLGADTASPLVRG